MLPIAILLAAWLGSFNGAAQPQPVPVPDMPKTSLPNQSIGSNPNIPGGLVDIAPDALGSRTGKRELLTLSGRRTSPMIVQTIELLDGQEGPRSSSTQFTPQSASYGLSVLGVRPNWNVSGLTGEMNGISVFLRQADGDTAGYLSNIGVRSGFAATLEGYTFASDAAGSAVRGVRTQLGVVNPRDGGAYGLVVSGTEGKGLTTALLLRNTNSATWNSFIEIANGSNDVMFRVDGQGRALAAGATLTKPLQLPGYKVADLPSCTQAAKGSMAHAVDLMTVSYNVSPVGGGSQDAPVYCNGINWSVH